MSLAKEMVSFAVYALPLSDSHSKGSRNRI
jgi:hypothetical protein